MQNIMAKEFFKNNRKTNYLDRKINDFPIVAQTPEAQPKDRDFYCISELNRYYKIHELFSNLRHHIESDNKNDCNYVKEFMRRQGIYDEKYYTNDRISHFLKFLFSKDFNINYSNPIQQIIKDATRDMSPYQKYIKNGVGKVKLDKCVEKDQYDFFHLNNVQTKIGNSVDRRIVSEFSDPRILIENLESDLCSLRAPKEQYLLKIKNKHIIVDMRSSVLQKNEKLTFMKKKNKLLEYIILQKCKNNLN
jgi:hypothetical protein